MVAARGQDQHRHALVADEVLVVANDPKYERRVPRIKVPTLVVGAEEDRVVPNEHVDRWAELVPGARLERVAGTGHGLLMQEPDRTAELILGFIEGVNR